MKKESLAGRAYKCKTVSADHAKNGNHANHVRKHVQTLENRETPDITPPQGRCVLTRPVRVLLEDQKVKKGGNKKVQKDGGMKELESSFNMSIRT